jgi:fumarylacetoacetase
MTWLKIPPQTDFSVHNLPYGIFSTPDRDRRAGVAIGEHVIDLAAVARLGLLDDLLPAPTVLEQPHLNDLIATGKATTAALRRRLQQWLTAPDSPLREREQCILPRNELQLHLPVRVGDYTDFYSSIEHATNVGKLFRDPENALLPNWKHLPVAYHGRASSIVVSGVDIRRPAGQLLLPGGDQPVFGPTERLDYELEVAFVIGQENPLGQPIATKEAEDYIFGLLLFNDWSARDIQRWEYRPLGPFLGKNFASSVSPWIVPLEALEPFRVGGPQQDPPVLPYLEYSGDHHFDIDLEVSIQPQNGSQTTVCRSNYRHLYWNPVQQLAHHTCNGCNVRVGDLLASGTISGRQPTAFGSLLEATTNGREPLVLRDGQQRMFLADHDTVRMRGFARRGEVRVGFGEVVTTILPNETVS